MWMSLAWCRMPSETMALTTLTAGGVLLEASTSARSTSLFLVENEIDPLCRIDVGHVEVEWGPVGVARILLGDFLS